MQSCEALDKPPFWASRRLFVTSKITAAAVAAAAIILGGAQLTSLPRFPHRRRRLILIGTFLSPLVVVVLLLT